MSLAHTLTGPPDAPVLVLLGSLGSTRAMWDPQVGPLAETLRVLAVDTRGHGGSAVVPGAATVGALAQDVLDLLDDLGLARVHLAGLSLGGTMAQWIAVHAPSRVASLALLATSARWPDAQPWRDRAAATRADGTASIAPAVVDRWFTPALAQRDPALVAWARDMVASVDGEGYAAACEALAAWDGRADLGRITARTLVVAGTDDPATPPGMLREIAEGITGAVLHELPGGHLVNLESAGAVTALLRAHVTGGDLYTRGLATRREVLGAAHVDRALAAVTPFSADWQAFITRTAWGDVWNRPGLDRRTRSTITLTALVALGNVHELALHTRAALTNGLTPTEIAELVLHAAVYTGVPRSNQAMGIIAEVLDQVAAESTPQP